MATRVVEGKKPYTGGKAISIDENKVISLNLRDENNLIIYDEGDDEIYVDLQLDDEITPTDAFPIGVNVGRAIVDNGWDKTGTIISAVTTSGDNIKIFYADDGTLWIDNGTGTFKQIYFKADVDALLLALRQYIDEELAKKQDVLTAGDGIDITNNVISNTLPGPTVSSTAPSNPSQGDLWYDTTNDELKVYDGSNWTGVGGGDVLVSTQANNIFTPGMKIWGGTESDYQSLTPDSNTAYLLLAGGPTPPAPRQPGVNTIAYYPLDSVNTVNDLSGNNYTLTNDNVSFVDNYAEWNSKTYLRNTSVPITGSSFYIGMRAYITGGDGSPRMLLPYNTRSFRMAAILSGTSTFYFNDTFGASLVTSFTAGSTPLLNKWIYVFLTSNNGVVEGGYVDGGVLTSATGPALALQGTGVTLGYNDGNSYHDYFYGRMSKIIIEDKAWTQQEITDYYDQTKGNYGIS